MKKIILSLITLFLLTSCSNVGPAKFISQEEQYSKDVQRQANIKSLSTGMEMFANDKGYYPSTAGMIKKLNQTDLDKQLFPTYVKILYQNFSEEYYYGGQNNTFEFWVRLDSGKWVCATVGTVKESAYSGENAPEYIGNCE